MFRLGGVLGSRWNILDRGSWSACDIVQVAEEAVSSASEFLGYWSQNLGEKRAVCW
jgi:hypothetical protein